MAHLQGTRGHLPHLAHERRLPAGLLQRQRPEHREPANGHTAFARMHLAQENVCPPAGRRAGGDLRRLALLVRPPGDHQFAALRAGERGAPQRRAGLRRLHGRGALQHPGGGGVVEGRRETDPDERQEVRHLPPRQSHQEASHDPLRHLHTEPPPELQPGPRRETGQHLDGALLRLRLAAVE